MLGTEKPVAFVATASPDKAHSFYKDTLGLTLIEDTPLAIVFEGNGTTIRIQKVESITPQPYTVLGWEVGDISNTIQKLTRKGLSFEFFDSLPQDEHGIWTTPNDAKVAWFQDPDGNRLSLTQTS